MFSGLVCVGWFTAFGMLTLAMSWTTGTVIRKMISSTSMMSTRGVVLISEIAEPSSSVLPTLIAIVNYENPTIVETVLHMAAKSVLPAPVRSFGLLSALVVARQVNDELKSLSRRVRKLEIKLLGARRISEAKNILMRTRQISETAAYDLIRDQAMAKRVTTEEIAIAIVNANEILSLGM